jgi:hypothetical protein
VTVSHCLSSLLNQQVAQNGRAWWESSLAEQLWFRKAACDMGLIGCPTASCNFTIEPSGAERERCKCELCHAEFCTECLGVYHYRTGCDDLVTLTRQWLEWRREGREGYLRQMAAHDQAYQVCVVVSYQRTVFGELGGTLPPAG